MILEDDFENKDGPKKKEFKFLGIIPADLLRPCWHFLMESSSTIKTEMFAKKTDLTFIF